MKNKKGKGNHQAPRVGSELESDLKLIQSDPRFAHVTSDPKFRHIPKKERKVKLDSRFHSILTDEKFYEKSTMDPRGRKGNYSTKEDLLRFYHLSSDENSEEENEEEEDEEENSEDSSEGEEAISINRKSNDCKTENKLKKTITTGKINEEGEEGEVKEDQGKSTTNQVAVNSEENSVSRDQEERLQVAPEITERLQDLNKDYARGGGDLFSSDSSDDDSSTTDDEAEEGEEFEWAELDQDAVWDDKAEVEETSRIAICNLDWDRIKAADLMVLFSSFCPLGGSVKSVSIYPSEYGKKRMAEEDCCGPPELTKGKGREKGAEKEEEEEKRSAMADNVDLDKLEKGKLDESAGATKQHFEALRRYQRNRLRYFYAVMECDSVDTARTLYHECDRQPFEGAGILLDLRYIPTDMDFEETPHDLCQTVPHSYKAKDFVTTALQNTRPSLTWDETDPERYKALTSAMTQALKGGQMDDNQLKDFLASSSEEEEEEDEEEGGNEEDNSSDEEGNGKVKAARIAKFRQLIKEIDEKEKKKNEREIDMEDTLEDCRSEEEEKEEENPTNIIKDGDTQLNPFEQYLEKRKAKRKEKRTKQKANKMQKEDGESDVLISDDDLPGEIGDLYSDPFFAEEIKKKKKKILLQDDETKEEDESNDKGNLELLLMEEDEKDKKHFNMREIIKNNEADTKKRRKNKLKKKMLEKQKEHKNKSLDDFKVNVSDHRFSELMTSGEYNIDPSHPQFKRTQAMDRLIGDIQRKRVAESGEEVPGAKRPNLGQQTKDLQLTSLVQRVKRKTGNMKRSSKRGASPD